VFDQGAAEAAKLGHIELVSGNSPALQAQLERLRAGQLNRGAVRPKRQRGKPPHSRQRVKQAVSRDGDLLHFSALPRMRFDHPFAVQLQGRLSRTTVEVSES
jgi:hypothetical protein